MSPKEEPKKSKKTSTKAASSKGGKALVIVESPTKQKTINRILGGDYIVKSSFGHVRDLPEKELGVDEKNGFAPKYIAIPKAKRNITELQALSKTAGSIYLATDPDREGESIAWHLLQLLGADETKARRITFHEITPTAVLGAIQSPRGIDNNLVEAQQARRVIDRLVGYKLSPLLWAKVGKGLSAGRVQSVAVRLLVERAYEIERFKEEDYWSIRPVLEKEKNPPKFETRVAQWEGKAVEQTFVHKLFAEDYRVKTTCFKTEASLAVVAEAMKKGPITVTKVESKETRQRPKPPFITSSLQQDAYSKLGFSSQKTMMVAQSLYEGVQLGGDEVVGLITYMRTDSVKVSKDIQDESRKFIASEYGPQYVPPTPNSYETKVKGAQEAHEAIHPTSAHRRPEAVKQYLTGDQARLYELIWLRFMASQMADAVFDSTSVDIAVGDPKEPRCLLKATGRVPKFNGYLAVYQEEKESDEEEKDEESSLPKMLEGDSLNLVDLITKAHKTAPPPAYNEASLIKALEKHGIGRPSTYAPIIKTIIDRKYIARVPKTGKLTATDLGKTVTGKLNEYFREIMDLSYTADVETKLDDIAEGKAEWSRVVGEFYGPFNKNLASAYDSMEAVRPKESDEKCPICGSMMLIRESRFGKYLSCSKFPRCKGKIRLDSEGKKLVPEKTDHVCDVCGKPLIIHHGRRGRFYACSGYPECKSTYSIGPNGEKIASFSPVTTERKCEKCGKAFLLRKGPKGYFLACSGYPRCKNIVRVTEQEINEILEKAGRNK